MSMKLMILGLLMESERHPYEIRQTIKMRNWSECFKLRDGSLYYAVDQLREDSLIEAAEVVSVPGDNRPDKTIYRVTDKGRAAFNELLYAQFKQISYPQHPLFLAMPFVRHSDPDKAIALIEEQLEASESRIQRMKAVLEIKEAFLPRGSAMMIRGFIQFSETERLWLTDVLTEARTGSLFAGPKWTLEEIEAYLKTQPPQEK
ncbi:transcriptional regulator [Paenibacillus baekrokdamisoli]|uniref:Transcriptional regulator n=1 Tax=Paenibacillus baekrokdamisoli TaxID=1712516 RepID=A0A3G9J887_9BACL|nr:PadR family transcriptional regulator [Paenibacillus baekrokdamisoli]MBB3072935.1 DNA-binding PadR family transcriptional regulator [Paenibacillus baekrokdamisoli]BBH22011.1 transcriptional regulator [Paenibacillus baekrokdamisoli]